jgi:hypothetical protein
LEGVISQLEDMAGMEPTTTMAAIIRAIAPITGIAEDMIEAITGEDGMTGTNAASINCKTHPGGLGKFSMRPPDLSYGLN